MGMGMRRCLVAVLLAGVAGGCSDRPHRGDTFAFDDSACFYLDEASFRDAALAYEAGSRPNIHVVVDDLRSGRMILVLAGNRVRVAEPTRGGAKVVIVAGKGEGLVGWMADRELRPERREP
jgi:hypothetical protein